MDVTPRKLTDHELKALVEAELQAAMGYMDSELSQQRADAMDRYLGEPLGTEMEGRSQVQTRDVMEVIEWIMPTLIRIFTNKDKAVEFSPVGPEDEEQAEQETQYMNYLFYKKNDGFLILYSWFKDALLQKNGIVKSYAEEEEETVKEEYNHITEIGLTHLVNEGYEIAEMESYTDTITLNDTGEQIDMPVYDVVVTKTEKEVEICTDVVPPEEFLISKDARSVDPESARFCAHRTTKTISEIREMGFTDDDIRQMDIGESEIELSEERVSRMHLDGEERWDESSEINISMRRVKWNECYVRVDANGDGKAELLKVFYSGEFIDYEEIDYHPFDALTPTILTHKFFGLSIADYIADLQEIRTTLFRSYMDNINQLINGRTFYDETTVNLDDMLTSKPFGLVAVDGPPGQAVLIDRPSGLPPEAFTLNDLLDKFLQSRVGDFQTQLDPNVLAQANTGVVINMLNEAKSKVEMIARIFAEVGVKKLFRTLHHLVRKHSDQQAHFQLKNNWVPINPTEWKERKNLTVNVGLGTQNQQEQLANINQVMQTQMQMMQMGIPTVMPQNIFNAAIEMTELMGLTPEKFWTPPEMIPPPPPQADAQMELIKMQQQVESAKIELDQQKAALEHQRKVQELQIKYEELSVKAQTEQGKQELENIKAQLGQVKDLSTSQLKELDFALKQRELDLKEETETVRAAMEAAKMTTSAEMEKYSTDVKAAIEILKQEAETDRLTRQQEMNLIGKLAADVADMRATPEDEEIEYDEAGRIIRIGNKRIPRDANGRATKITRSPES